MRISELNFYKNASNRQRAKDTEQKSSLISEKKTYAAGLSIVILNLNKPEYIIPLLKQLVDARTYFRSKNVDFQILVGDTGSTDADVLKTFQELKEDVFVLRELAYNFSKTNNLVFQEVRCSHVLFLNNDIRFESPTGEYLFDMYKAMLENPSIGIFGAILRFQNGGVQHAGVDFFRKEELRAFCYHPLVAQNIPVKKLFHWMPVPAVTGAFLMMTSALFQEVGGFSDVYQAECQDVDLCLHVHRLGYQIAMVTSGHVIHYENGTRKKGEENWPDRQIFMRRWSSYVEAAFL